jgi:hypothetical protein
MADNDVVLINQVLAEQQTHRAIPMKEDTAFEHFAAQQVIKSRDLSVDEVADGVIGGGNDGGLDAIYVFLNGALLSEDSEVFDDDFSPAKVPPGSILDLWLIQAKRETSFTETAIDKVASAASRLMNLGESEEALRGLYSDVVVAKFSLFRRALTRIASRHPKVVTRFSYVTKGKIEGIDTKVQIKARDLEGQFRAVVSEAGGETEFLGASELWARYNQVATYTSQLTYFENASATAGSAALVTLREYYAFLTNQAGELRREIFDWNVRDYQGDVEVNREISESLADPDGPEFWWLNNGVTIVCSRSTITNKTYSLDDVQIVNGLQTSHTIFLALNGAELADPAWDRAILVRILVIAGDAATRDKVIRATNRQTSVPAASLRATDEVQRNIESYFSANSWWYDRRKNYYRNAGKSPDRIIGIPLLAQAVMAMGLSRPDDSRARPSSLLKRDDDYRKIFSSDVPLATYLWLARTQRAVDGYLSSDEAGASAQERTNFRFHLAMLVVARQFGARVHSPRQLSALADAGTIASSDLIAACLAAVREALGTFPAATDPIDKIAKGPEFVQHLLGVAAGATARAEPPSEPADGGTDSGQGSQAPASDGGA